MDGTSKGDAQLFQIMSTHPRLVLGLVGCLIGGGAVAGVGWTSVQRDISEVHQATVDTKSDVSDLRRKMDGIRDAQVNSNAKLDWLVRNTSTK